MQCQAYWGTGWTLGMNLWPLLGLAHLQGHTHLVRGLWPASSDTSYPQCPPLLSFHRVCKGWVPCHFVKSFDENRQRTLHIPYMINWYAVRSCVGPLHTLLCPGCSGNTFEQMNKLSSTSFSLLSLKYLYLKLVMRLPQEKSFPQRWHQDIRAQGHAHTPSGCHVKRGCWAS